MNENNLPRISIVTPSYNQGQYLEATIKSVLGQNYPNLEYFIIDGGSIDDSVDIIKKYKNQLAFWTSEPDNGQTSAINKGLNLITGDIWAYLCSDDTYNKNVFFDIKKQFIENPDIDVIYGDCNWIDEFGNLIRRKKPSPYSVKKLLKDNFLYQPSIFLRKRVLVKYGYFDENLKYAMDYEYWLRISKDSKFKYLHIPIANYRLHSSSKTVGQLRAMRKEMIKIKKVYGRGLHAKFSYWYYLIWGIKFNRLKQYYFKKLHRKIFN